MLTVENLCKHYASEGDTVKAVNDITFSVAAGEFFTLLGPSGCGKSSTLRCIAGLERISGGEIAIDGEIVASESRFVDPNHRPISMVFQSYAIWPHMTVLQNVVFPLSYRASGGLSRRERRERGMDALRMVQLDHLADRDAPYLSGGQQQRVALARSLVVRPKLLLLDEPLSNLDAKLREEMRFEIKKLTRGLGISTIYVTHDQAEALSMSDRIAVMSEGRILQMGSSRQIYLEPVSSSVARIVGNVNVLRGTVVRTLDASREAEVRLQSGALFRCLKAEGGIGSDNVEIMFRPELVRVREREPSASRTEAEPDSSVNTLSARVSSIEFTGDYLKCHFDTADGQLIGKLAPDVVISEGIDITLQIKVENCVAH